MAFIRWSPLLLLVLLSIAKGCVRKGYECPEYAVVSQHADYEERAYPSLVWATTSETAGFFRVATYRTFMRLFQYINGENVNNMKINMTVPVRTIAIMSGDEKTYNMSFLLPASVADDPPLPFDRRVIISKEEATHYVVRSFPGYVWRQSAWKREAKNLADSVADDPSVDTSQYFMCGYDSPFSFFNRLNEIWMVKNAQDKSNEIFSE